jgi:uncharacterized protein (TIGR02246 family)
MKDVRRMRLAIALGALTLGACNPAMVNQASEEQTIRGLENDWQRAIVARDVNTIVGLHAPDAVLMVSNTPAASGSAAIRAAYNELFKSPGVSLTWVPTKIDVASPTVATDIGTYTLAFDTPQGRVTDHGNYSTVWHKIDGQWRVAVDAPVSTTPLPMPGASSASMDAPDMQMLAVNRLAWSDFSSPGFDPGMKLAVLHGDPGKKGDYTLRLQFPAGYKFPVHWHPGGEHLTVVSGTFMLGMGNVADWTAVRTYAPGDFIYIPARHSHYGGAGPTTVIQLHGEGPFQLFLGGSPK